MTDPVQPRPQPVVDAASIGGKVSAALVAVSSVYFLVQAGISPATITGIGVAVQGAVTAVVALAVYLLPLLHARSAAQHVTPLADPHNAQMEPLVDADSYGRHAAAVNLQTQPISLSYDLITADRSASMGPDLPTQEQPAVTYRLGRKPNDPTRRRVRLTADLVPALTPPASVDWYSKVPASTWGMDGNDQLGDCTCAEVDHAVKTLQVAAGNTEVKSSAAEVVTLYEKAAGYNPADPNTDQGAEMQAIRDYWRRNGVQLGGTKHTILLFAEVDHANHDLVKWCISRFGELGVGINFPSSAMAQFNQGKPWDVVKGSPIEGGHAIAAIGYDAQYVYVVTWGQVQKMTWAFWDAYVEETWTQLSSEFVSSVSGNDPLGETLHALGDQYAAVTGQANPIPAPAPTPTPAPTPVPVPPAPVGFPLSEVTPWLQHGYVYTHVEKAAKAAIEAWLASS